MATKSAGKENGTPPRGMGTPRDVTTGYKNTGAMKKVPGQKKGK